MLILQFETKVDKYIRAMSSFRDEIRKLAIAGGSNKDILALCDRFRDQDLVNLGVQLDDGAGAGQYGSPRESSVLMLSCRRRRAVQARRPGGLDSSARGEGPARGREGGEEGRFGPGSRGQANRTAREGAPGAPGDVQAAARPSGPVLTVGRGGGADSRW